MLATIMPENSKISGSIGSPSARRFDRPFVPLYPDLKPFYRMKDCESSRFGPSAPENRDPQAGIQA